MISSVAEWIESAEGIAYGVLNLKPREFEELQPHEFENLLRGYEARRAEENKQRAYWTANLMNCWIKNPITPKDLWEPLIQPEPAQKKIDDREYFEKMFPWKFADKEG